MELRSTRALIRTSLAGALFALVALAVAAGGYSTYRPGPQGVLRVRQPVLEWRITPTGGVKVTGSTMTINGSTVDARYSSADGALTYRPEKPFAPGTYSVECTVELDKQWKAEQKWAFTVSENAFEALPQPDDLQNEGLQAANRFRRTLGLPDFQLDARLCAAAQNHALFMRTNRTVGHYQKEGMPEFLGVKPIDRAQGFGHTGGVWENVAMARTTPTGFMHQLFDAPYHRLPFMQPGAVAFGAGFDQTFSCVDFGGSSSEGLVVSPGVDQTGVPASWDGCETPSPLAIHRATGPVGYPIVFASFTKDKEAILVDTAKLSGPAGDVPVYVNSSANDPELTFALVVIPRAPLAKGATYEVEVAAHTASGKRLAKTWRFTTAP
jgi:uncharacterized protein YkwD